MRPVARRHRRPASKRPRRVSPATAPTASRTWANEASCRLHLLTTAAGARQKDFFERGVARFDDLAAERKDRVVKFLERPAVNDAPRTAAALHRQRRLDDRRLIEVFGETHAAPLVATAH